MPFRTDNTEHKHTTMATGLEDCPICLSGIEQANRARLLPFDKQATTCNHVFHFDCITHWTLNYHNTCPTCRQISSAVEYNIKVVNGVMESSQKMPINETSSNAYDEEIGNRALAILSPVIASFEQVRHLLHRLLAYRSSDDGLDEESESSDDSQIGDTEMDEDTEMYDSSYEEPDDEEMPLLIVALGNADDPIIIEDDDEDIIIID